jgi:hypothetical protein
LGGKIATALAGSMMAAVDGVPERIGVTEVVAATTAEAAEGDDSAAEPPRATLALGVRLSRKGWPAAWRQKKCLASKGR